MDAAVVFSDADAAALYDLLNPWDPEQCPGDAFYDELVMAAASVLDVGCGTGAMLHLARERGHPGRLVGLDPDRAALARARARARHRAAIEWVEGTAAAAARWDAAFDLATMTSHAFQCLFTDAELRASLAAVHTALRNGGRFAFETRHPQARAWEEWNPSEASDIVDSAGRALRVWHETESVIGDLVTFTGTTAAADGTVLRVDRTSLRFLDVAKLDAFLVDAGFAVEARYGTWDGGPVTGTSREIITIARRR
ncbi:class I SAM-dependent methyltransferase [Streptomyces sp. Isolate_219]|uniref:class I SAM-dependent methyltransferase n=1 Tax=Streptomyces sp. Isolate_219 TaxID=2950110 RepID=UPI0021CA4894|nr:class I SAM-dependent methyltransferase [Streptomyces sp. Isolate_219]MCR8573817.1 class I SAM-dependent methyltransferase [Streptomyces sp. Isolate_219]